MHQATTHLRHEAGRWAIEIDGAPYRERDYDDIASATRAIAQILRQAAAHCQDLDEDACRECDKPPHLLVCSQCGVDAFVLTCDHGGPRPIRTLEGAPYCRKCRRVDTALI